MSETRFWIQRLSKTAVRAFHILGIAGSAGGIFYGVDKTLWLHWWIMAMVTGCLMVIFEIRQSRLWLIQLKGVLTFVKLAMIASFALVPQWKPELFIFVLLMSVVIAHGPAGLRHYSIWHRRRIEDGKGKKKPMNG
ncbi:membrane protein [Photobacterium aquae]|uniref:Membrane protein n=2 Tax=Photobacterium aquae TaxID=1195763 RepID=A0A0J1H0C7_9GAMM|nr:membrane protein [Photobacterium aquae]